MTNKPTIRASSLPRLKVCPASYVESMDKVNPSSIEAALGTAFHAAMAVATQHGRGEVDIEHIANAHGVILADLTKLWHGFPFDPDHGSSERSVEFSDERVRISGRLDWVDEVEPGTYSLADWKTTHRIEEDPEPWNDPQTQAYAIGFLMQNEAAMQVRTQKVYVRRGENGWSQAYTITREMMTGIADKLLEIAHRALDQVDLEPSKRDYTLSPSCSYCPGRASCPAIRREVTAALSALKDVPILKKDGTPSKRSETVLDLVLTIETIPKWHEVTKLLGKAKDAIHEQIKLAVDALGPIEIAPDKFLAVKVGHRRIALSEKIIREAAQSAEIEADKIDHMLAWLEQRDTRPEARLDIYSKDALEKAD